MPQFRYRAVTTGGEIVIGEVEAPSRDEVVRRIQYLGHLPIEAKVITPGGLVRAAGMATKAPRPADVTLFLRQLALLLAAGLTLEAALQTLAEEAGKALARFARSVRKSIAVGESFAEALARQSAVIDPAYVAMVRAGEATGKLEPVLRAIVDDRTRQALLAAQVRSATRYPLLLVGSAMLVLFFFFVYVVPQFEPVFKDLGGRLNAGAAFVVALSTWLQANLNLFLGACAALTLGGWFLARKPACRAKMMAMVAMLPGISGTLGDRRTARLVATLGMLIGNGVALPTALKILRDIIAEPHYVAALDRVYEQVRNGRRFGDALAETDLLPPLAVRMLRVGDETGDLATIARHAAQFYEHKVSISLDRLMAAVGPVTIILVSIVIGALIISIMSALLNITELAT